MEGAFSAGVVQCGEEGDSQETREGASMSNNLSKNPVIRFPIGSRTSQNRSLLRWRSPFSCPRSRNGRYWRMRPLSVASCRNSSAPGGSTRRHDRLPNRPCSDDRTLLTDSMGPRWVFEDSIRVQVIGEAARVGVVARTSRRAANRFNDPLSVAIRDCLRDRTS